MALFVWGSNASQQLGLDVDDKELYDVRKVDALDGHLIVDFSAGENHSLAVNEFGDVFAWGRGKEGQLGLGQHQEPIVRTPQRVTALDGHIVTKVSCGDMHSLALSAAGDVFMWGLLPETRHVRNDGAFDHASVSLTGLSQQQQQAALSPRSLHHSMSDNIMSRLMRDSELVYETASMGDIDSNVGTDSADLADLGRQKVQTVRHPSFVPRLCTSLARVVVTNIAAGFAHSLATTDTGAVFSCGYNDNGQLGTGSRRNAADFQRVQALDGYVITHVACGQQHSLACSQLSTEDSDSDSLSRSGVCFSWGLGILGQLGSGINISWLPMRVDVSEPVVSVAAGSHHSVAVARSGRVYSWGHSEYGQHGAGELFYDLQRGAHYFFPRVQEALAHESVHVASVACSSHSTFALARDGSVYSWGWNAFGVLGVGKYQHSVHPAKVFGLRDNAATHVGAGSNHGAAVVRPRGAHYSLRYDHVLASGAFADVAFTVSTGRTTTAKVAAHQVVVTARCGYLKGLLRVVAASASDSDKNDTVLTVDAFSDVDAQVFRAFLVFLYTNRVEIASHKRRALGDLAKRVCLDELVLACEDVWRKQPARPDATDGDALDEARQFARDMEPAVLSPDLSDVVFLWPADDTTTPPTVTRLPAHKAVLSQVDYFRTMFTGGFSEGAHSREIALHYMHRDGVTLAAFQHLLRWIYTGSCDLVERLEPNETMDLFVTASLMGLSHLASLCELQLTRLLPHLDADSVAACLDFAERFDARRLKTRSRQQLEKNERGDEEEEEKREL